MLLRDFGGSTVKNGYRTVEIRNGISASAITGEGEAPRRPRARTHSRDPVSCTSFFEASEGIQDPAGREIAAENPLQYFYWRLRQKKREERNTKESAIESREKFRSP